MITYIRFIESWWIGREGKKEDGGDKTPLISISKFNKLDVLLYFSTYKLWVKLLWYAKNTFCILDQLIINSHFLHFFRDCEKKTG